MKRDPVHVALQALAEVASRPHDAAALALVRASLGHRSNHVVGRAARVAREANLTALAPDLVASFPRFLEDPIRRDPGCVAKAEIVHALLSFEHPAPDVFLRGAAHVQKEPASDVALLFRFLALRGDDEPEVLADVFAGLLALAAGDAVPLVVERLTSENRDIARAAAMALGEAGTTWPSTRFSAWSPGARLPTRRPPYKHFVSTGTTRPCNAVYAVLDARAFGPVAPVRRGRARPR
jgi:hypothetical protein